MLWDTSLRLKRHDFHLKMSTELWDAVVRLKKLFKQKTLLKMDMNDFLVFLIAKEVTSISANPNFQKKVLLSKAAPKQMKLKRMRELSR